MTDTNNMPELQGVKDQFLELGDPEGYNTFLQLVAKTIAKDPNIPVCADEIMKIMQNI